MAEVEPRRTDNTTRFFDACRSGDLEVVRSTLKHDPACCTSSSPFSHNRGWWTVGWWVGWIWWAQSPVSGACRFRIEHRRISTTSSSGKHGLVTKASQPACLAPRGAGERMARDRDDRNVGREGIGFQMPRLRILITRCSVIKDASTRSARPTLAPHRLVAPDTG